MKNQGVRTPTAHMITGEVGADRETDVQRGSIYE